VLKPLDNKINSSDVERDAVPVDISTAAARDAEQLYHQILAAPENPDQGDHDAYAEMQREFEDRCRHMQMPVAAQVRRTFMTRLSALWSKSA
jgi:hypothetical protein